MHSAHLLSDIGEEELVSEYMCNTDTHCKYSNKNFRTKIIFKWEIFRTPCCAKIFYDKIKTNYCAVFASHILPKVCSIFCLCILDSIVLFSLHFACEHLCTHIAVHLCVCWFPITFFLNFSHSVRANNQLGHLLWWDQCASQEGIPFGLRLLHSYRARGWDKPLLGGHSREFA